MVQWLNDGRVTVREYTPSLKRTLGDIRGDI